MKKDYPTQYIPYFSFLCIVLFSYLLFVKGVSAQTSGNYTFLEPLPNFPTTISRANLFAQYAQRVFLLILQTSAILGVLAIAYGGIQYITAGGSESNKGEAKKRIWNGMQGFLLIAGAWLILYTLNPRIINFSLCIPKVGVTDLFCGKDVPVLKSTPIPKLPSTTSNPTTSNPSTASSYTGTEAEVRKQLEDAGIVVKKSNTTVAGLRQGTIDNIILMKKQCGCSVTITGGTETTAGHAQPSAGNNGMSHLNGYKVDVSPSSGFNSYMTSLVANNTIKYDHTSNDGALYKGTFNGSPVQVIDEKNHYDILFNTPQ